MNPGATRQSVIRVAAWRPGLQAGKEAPLHLPGVPKAGWVRFRWSRAVPVGVKSYRVTCDRSGRWHLAFAVIPDPVPAPGNGQAVGVDRGVTVSAALSTGEMLRARAKPTSAAWPAVTPPTRM